MKYKATKKREAESLELRAKGDGLCQKHFFLLHTIERAELGRASEVERGRTNDKNVNRTLKFDLNVVSPV